MLVPSARQEIPRWLPRQAPRISSWIQLVGDETALDFAGRCPRDRLDNVHPLGDLELGQQPAAVGDQLLFRHRLGQDDRGGYLFAPGGMRYPEADRFLHGGMRLEGFVDLPRSDFLATSVDELLDPSQQVEISVSVEGPLV